MGKKVYFGDQGLMSEWLRRKATEKIYNWTIPEIITPPGWSFPWPGKAQTTLAGCNTLIRHLPGLLFTSRVRYTVVEAVSRPVVEGVVERQSDRKCGWIYRPKAGERGIGDVAPDMWETRNPYR